ncbi:nickel pincer cofactor biosynthesis protein LarB [Sulfurospirillum deleyianum]|uniref:1-(5-phosphoribosyl)-5-amino-4-imidazole-carboxylate (AIR) carboxylase n=1 Tax=Sulfurospirillum deleyianum (strain ATCC 51133 / DSM 6946 / 5175) TaxID=525898 RepID=D1B2I1_SULD5|nr:nickel pincer cofactor biosynthesis protein LarB [Sulfurospirillum deleyianum]ACZ12301.1 1-(5-phosphoribosyl)-5-amino-4-imidazole- carboxylate (AIR) carboxylase [Sulfurospirillum deleyianum DSM 6946]
MSECALEALLQGVKEGHISIQDAVQKMKAAPFEDIDFAKIDHHRSLRQGYPEVIYGESKTAEQILGITEKLFEKGNNILITRASIEVYQTISARFLEAKYNALGRTITLHVTSLPKPNSYIAIVAAGTSDLYVVEEAYETALILGNDVQKIVDVGVAGIHRLFAHLEIIQNAKVVIVIAGMEGALASVIGGLVDKPVIAVPTSVGYGASFGGVAALLSMLNSCASGVSVVNIDNGFGAAYNASIINHL